MSILTTHNLGLSFGDFDLFNGISVYIANDSKIGLIGPNGIGKTSLLLILAGLNQPTTGSVNVTRERRLGYLRQESVEAFAARENSVYAEMETVFAHLKGQEARLHEMEAAMSLGEFTDSLLGRYGALQESFEHGGGYDYDVRIRRTLQGLGLGEKFWHVPLCQLSGGQQTRALLARLLLEQPDLLILDEPTNHLDSEAIEWLERTLSQWAGAILVVSHDRYFLDNVVNTVWEMSRSGIQVYKGNYSAYLHQRQERWELQFKVYAEEKARLEKQLNFIQRNIARASTNARAVGLLRRLSRDLVIVENLGVMGLRSNTSWLQMDLGNVRPLGVADAARRIHNLPLPNGRPPRINIRLKTSHHSGRIVLRVKDLCVGYPGNLLFSIPELALERGEIAAIIGPNGSGKTTLLKTILGQLDPLAGQAYLGTSLKIGYFAQAHDDLSSEDSVLEALLRNREIPLGQARSHLAQYLFRGDEVFKPVSALSGGERGRLAIAILALEGANFLLLDEPTNHLDIPAQEVLQEALEGFPGTILLVSHDRYLVDRLATQIWELGAGRLRLFKGSYRQLAESRAKGQASAQPPGFKVSSPTASLSTATRRDGKSPQALAALEERIAKGEAALTRLSQDLQQAGDGQSFEELHRLSLNYARVQSDLEELMTQWEELAV